MPKDPLELLVFGTGAVGAVFGWRAAQSSGVRVSTVCRSNYEAVKRQGFLMQTKMWGNGIFQPHRVVRNVKEIQGVEFDYIIFANKVVDSLGTNFIRDIRTAVTPKTTLVSAQNGFCVDSILREAFPDNIILSSICYVSCMQNIPGIIEQVATIRPKAFHIGTYFNKDHELAISRLRSILQMDETAYQQTNDIVTDRWTKLIFNGSWNPVAALFRMTTHEIYANPEAVNLVQALANEVYAIALANGVNLSPETPINTTNYCRDQPPITLSMLQDVRAGRAMEIEALCGSIVRLAERKNIPTPALQTVYSRLLSINHDLSLRNSQPDRVQVSL